MHLPRPIRKPHACKQQGAALMLMLVIMVLGAATVLVTSLNSSRLKMERDKITADALAQAKEALIGDAISASAVTATGYLRLPDLGFQIGPASSEGSSTPNFTGNNADYSVIGKVPWKTIGIPPLRDGKGECLWYVVSGRFKNNPKTNTFNWDTQGQIDVIDGNGSVIANNLAALLVAPGQPIDGQSRTMSDAIYKQCGGNYDAHNYLDAYNISDAVSGEVNYFTGSTNSRVSLNTNNKRFVQTGNDHYNDQFLFVTTDDIFRPIIRRSDFRDQISSLMNDSYFNSVSSDGSNKGTGNINCINLSTPENQIFCNNWREMLLLTKLNPKEYITINGAPTDDKCKHVLIFGGQKSAGQVRISAMDKANPANYLESPNLAAFATPEAIAGDDFNGIFPFNPNSPSADVMKCLP